MATAIHSDGPLLLEIDYLWDEHPQFKSLLHDKVCLSLTLWFIYVRLRCVFDLKTISQWPVHIVCPRRIVGLSSSAAVRLRWQRRAQSEQQSQLPRLTKWNPSYQCCLHKLLHCNKYHRAVMILCKDWPSGLWTHFSSPDYILIY